MSTSLCVLVCAGAVDGERPICEMVEGWRPAAGDALVPIIEAGETWVHLLCSSWLLYPFLSHMLVRCMDESSHRRAALVSCSLDQLIHWFVQLQWFSDAQLDHNETI